MLKKDEKRWLAIAIFLILFFVFLIFKIYGYFDYTGKYGIRALYCEKEYQSLLFTLDGEKKTTWGMNEEYSKDDNFSITFRKKRTVKELRIYNAEAATDPTKAIEIYGAADGSGWVPCPFVQEMEGENLVIYKLAQPVEVEQLLLHYVEEENGHWPITELYIE